MLDNQEANTLLELLALFGMRKAKPKPAKKQDDDYEKLFKALEEWKKTQVTTPMPIPSQPLWVPPTTPSNPYTYTTYNTTTSPSSSYMWYEVDDGSAALAHGDMPGLD